MLEKELETLVPPETLLVHIYILKHWLTDNTKILVFGYGATIN
jgi:hypothetical protein